MAFVRGRRGASAGSATRARLQTARRRPATAPANWPQLCANTDLVQHHTETWGGGNYIAVVTVDALALWVCAGWQEWWR